MLLKYQLQVDSQVCLLQPAFIEGAHHGSFHGGKLFLIGATVGAIPLGRLERSWVIPDKSPDVNQTVIHVPD